VAKRSFDPRWVSLVLRVAVGGVFIFSGYTKIVAIDETIRSVRNYQLLPEAVVPTVGSALPVLELLLAVLLVAGIVTRISVVVTFVVSLAFFVGVAAAWARGLQIECGCFGNGGYTSDPVPGYVRELVLNGCIMLACGWLFRRGPGQFSVDAWLGLTPEADIPGPAPEESEPSIGVQQ
jgi:uncharacterized membrane protein YphA (DoxX/SURF4 family)